MKHNCHMELGILGSGLL